MTFTLTEELTDSIISAMENQETVFVVDAKANQLVVQESNPDDDIYYSLPEWRPADGFSIREDFVKQLHAPLAHDELQNVLHSGRGVFKGFRNVLKNYPDIDKRWHIYKHRIMSARVNEWYNSLREIWGLEKLDQLMESDDALVHDDFSFKEYDSEADKKSILFNITASNCDESELPFEVGEAIVEMWKNRFEKDGSAEKIGYVCYSHSDEFAGCITASRILENQEKIMVITSLFVPEQFRGLGICTELLSMCISKLQSCRKKWVLLPEYLVPEIIQPLLTRTGFERKQSGYILFLGD